MGEPFGAGTGEQERWGRARRDKRVQRRERADGVPLTGLEHSVERLPGIVDNLWLEQAPARGGDIAAGKGGEQLVEEDASLVRCFSL
jgi:hypothetical protein